MTIDEIKQANRDAGRYFFAPDTLRFFNGRVHSRVYGGEYFVTSEQYVGYGVKRNRRYTVRHTVDGVDIDTVGEFQQYRTSAQAHSEARRLASELFDETTVCKRQAFANDSV